MDIDGFYSTLERLQGHGVRVRRHRDSNGSRQGLGPQEGGALKYASSGDTTGDKRQVVGYGSLKIRTIESDSRGTLQGNHHR